MVVSGSLNRWQVAYIPPEGKEYKWYMSGIYIIYTANWGILCYRSHLLREPGNSIDHSFIKEGRELKAKQMLIFEALIIRPAIS